MVDFLKFRKLYRIIYIDASYHKKIISVKALDSDMNWKMYLIKYVDLKLSYMKKKCILGMADKIIKLEYVLQYVI